MRCCDCLIKSECPERENDITGFEKCSILEAITTLIENRITIEQYTKAWEYFKAVIRND